MAGEYVTFTQIDTARMGSAAESLVALSSSRCFHRIDKVEIHSAFAFDPPRVSYLGSLVSSRR